MQEGGDLYGGTVDNCVLQNFLCSDSYSCSGQVFNHIFRPQSLSVSSDPLMVCLCNSNVIVRCGDLVIPVAAYPGKSISVSVATLGQRYGGTAGVIRAQTLNRKI